VSHGSPADGQTAVQPPGDRVGFTFRARHRIRRRTDFQRVYDQGRKLHGRLMTLVILQNDWPLSRLGVAATRKLGDAVQRNRAKRRLRDIFRRNAPAEPVDVVVIPRPAMLGARPAEVEAEFLSLLRRRGHARGGSPRRTRLDH
jgi:ribonuclease P protein component